MTAGRSFAVFGIAAVAILAVATYLAYAQDMRTISARLVAGAQVIQTSHGQLEYAVGGNGPAVLVLHGAGGGFDQGNLLVSAIGSPGFRWITVSRFGYLGSALPADASTAAQADVLVELLDSLGIETAAVLAMSGGVPPALQFATRHPERTAALVLLSSAPYTPLPTQAKQLPAPIWVYQALFKSNFPYWILQKIVRAPLATMFDATPALKASMSLQETAFLDGMVDAFQPVRARYAGLQNEAAAIDPAATYHLSDITAPTLIFHAKDDGLNPFSIAEHTAANIPGAVLMPFTRGGHLLLTHHSEVRDAVADFLKASVGE